MKFFRKKTCLKILLPLVFLAAASVAVPAAGFDRALQDLPSEDTSVSATQSSAVVARENAARELSQLCEAYFVAGNDSLSSDEAWKILELWAAATGENPPNRSEAWLCELTGMRDAGTAARYFVRTLGRREAVRAGSLSSIDGIPGSVKARKRSALIVPEKIFQAKLVEAAMRSPADCTQAHSVFGEELLRVSDLEKFFRESDSGRVLVSLIPYAPGGMTAVPDDFIGWIESLPESRIRELGNFTATDYRLAMMQVQSLGLEIMASLIEKNPALKARMKSAESLPSAARQWEVAAIQEELVNSVTGELVKSAVSDKKYKNAKRVFAVIKLVTPENLTTRAERIRWERQLSDAELTRIFSFTVSDVRRAISDMKKYCDSSAAAFIAARPYLPKLFGDET